jgi:hypothetical protein
VNEPTQWALALGAIVVLGWLSHGDDASRLAAWLRLVSRERCEGCGLARCECVRADGGR